jgi:hypothetical protein
MERTGPRSTVVDLRWRPCLAFYEHGVEILRHLEDDGLLRQFRVNEHAIDARLADGTYLRIGVAGMAYTAPLGALPATESARITDHVVHALKPADVELVIYLAHLEALDWDLPYEDACQKATSAWLPNLSADAGIFDSAPLVDGTTSRHGLRYQAEFGIVDARQAPDRLSRVLGNRVEGPVLPRREQEARDLPPLAVFVDSSWFPQDAPSDAEDLTTWVPAVLGEAMEEAHDLTSSLHQVCENAHRRTEAGMEVS